MKAYKIKELKNFMSRLLGSGAFDGFLLAEASVSTYNTFFIDGHMNKDFFTGDLNDDVVLPKYEFSMWQDMRSLCFDLIKGKRTPVNFKFVLHLKPELAEELLAKNESAVSSLDLKAFVLNIKYDGSELTCITATAFHTFIPDKTPDQIWDAYMVHFFEQNSINYESC
ncbi:MAG: DUF5721 family protein [Lachnospiraceae bacterium]|nr:DUF5721 family protein [Lachnospiraceae bacterium]